MRFIITFVKPIRISFFLNFLLNSPKLISKTVSPFSTKNFLEILFLICVSEPAVPSCLFSIIHSMGTRLILFRENDYKFFYLYTPREDKFYLNYTYKYYLINNLRMFYSCQFYEGFR